jgi:hypothetical protein
MRNVAIISSLSNAMQNSICIISCYEHALLHVNDGLQEATCMNMADKCNLTEGFQMPASHD